MIDTKSLFICFHPIRMCAIVLLNFIRHMPRWFISLTQLLSTIYPKDLDGVETAWKRSLKPLILGVSNIFSFIHKRAKSTVHCLTIWKKKIKKLLLPETSWAFKKRFILDIYLDQGIDVKYGGRNNHFRWLHSGIGKIICFKLLVAHHFKVYDKVFIYLFI